MDSEKRLDAAERRPAIFQAARHRQLTSFSGQSEALGGKPRCKMRLRASATATGDAHSYRQRVPRGQRQQHRLPARRRRQLTWRAVDGPTPRRDDAVARLFRWPTGAAAAAAAACLRLFRRQTLRIDIFKFVSRSEARAQAHDANSPPTRKRRSGLLGSRRAFRPRKGPQPLRRR